MVGLFNSLMIKTLLIFGNELEKCKITMYLWHSKKSNMRPYLWITLLSLSVLTNVNSQTPYNVDIFDFAKPRDPKTLPMPDPAILLSGPELEAILGLPSQSVTVKSPKDAGGMQVKNTFYKWNDPTNPNTGIFIQLMTNPVFDEYEEYNSIIVSSKLLKGEAAPGLPQPISFKEKNVGKLKVAYSVEGSRVYWNIGNNYAISLSFNMLGLNEPQLVKIIDQLIPTFNKNLLAKLLE